MKAILSRSVGLAVGLICGASVPLSSASADMVVHSAHRQSQWLVDAAYNGYHGSGYDTNATFDTPWNRYWYEFVLGDYFDQQAYIPGWGFVWIDASAYGFNVGSRFSRDSFVFNVGGVVGVRQDGWATATISGLLDTTFTLDRDSAFDFHTTGAGSRSITLWNDVGDVITSLSGDFASTGVLGPGRYRLLAGYSNSTGIGGSSGGLWVSVPAPGSIALLGAGALVALRRRR